MSVQLRASPRVRSSVERASWDPARLTASAVLGAWAVLFWAVMLTDRVDLFLSGRTRWLAPVGASVMTLAAAGGIVAARRRGPGTVTRRGALTAALMILPVVVLLSSPPATLGAFSASRKAPAAGGGGLWTYFGTFDRSSEITLPFVTAAKYWPEAGRLLASRAGSEVEFVGFVDRDPSMPADEFTLTRFVVTCCVADAAVVTVRVVGWPTGSLVEDSWVTVRGTIFPIGSEIVVVAASVEDVPRPDLPYITL